MDEIKWIKIVTDVFDNRKIKMIESMPEGDTLLVVWFKILTLAGQINDGGLVYFTKDIPYTEQLLATQFNRPLSIIQLALNTFERLGMIEIANDVIMVSNWEKYQNVDGMDKVREQTRKRVADYRQRQKALVSNVTSNATVTLGNATEERKKNKKEKKNISPDILTDITPNGGNVTKKKQFVPPTLEELEDFCFENNLGIDPATFIDYYNANGWMAGKNHMKDWQATARNWDRRRKNTANSPQYGGKNARAAQDMHNGFDMIDSLVARMETNNDNG